MTPEKRSFVARVFAGMLLGSLLSAMWFHLFTGALQTEVDDISTHLALVVFEATFVLVIFLVIGLPMFLLARRYSVANSSTASLAGVAIALLVSTLYGGPDLGGAATFFIITFGGAGLLAAIPFWLCVRDFSVSPSTTRTSR